MNHERIDVEMKLKETNEAIEMIRSAGGEVPPEAFEMQEIMQRCVAAETMANTDDSSKLDIGREAYEAYCLATGWKSLVTGQSLPQWPELSDPIRLAWMCSAAWVVGRVLRKYGVQK